MPSKKADGKPAAAPETAPTPDNLSAPGDAERPTDAGDKPPLEIATSRNFVAWLAETGASLAVSTYQAGMLLLLYPGRDGRLSLFNRHLERPMGLAGHSNGFFTTSAYQIHRFENALPAGERTGDGYDRAYVPQVAWTTGDIDTHDLGTMADGRPAFVATLFSCIATVSETHSLVPLWTPPWISRLAAEDRCHLNGLALENGRPRFATAVAMTDTADGWRDHRVGGGVAVDIDSNEPVATGLSMPHSPRLYRDRLWLHNSGTGEFGTLDLAEGRFEPIAFCPGYLRGLDFIGRYAVMGLSLPRSSKSMSGLPLEDELAKRSVSPRCALYVVDLESGDIVHWCRFEGVIEELYDLCLLPDCSKPMLVGFKGDEIRRVISLGDAEALPGRTH